MRRATDFYHFSTVDPGASRCLYGRGFTLVEMIISIVIAGVVLSMVSLFGRQQIEAYIDVGNRADLADAADTALRRVARDLQSALPNSVRQSGNFIEFVPIRGAGRYRADVDNTGAGNFLDFGSTTDNSFDVLGPTVTITTGDELVIYNLGQPGSDVYAGTSRRAATAGANLSSVTFTPGGTQFPLASPQSRFQIVGQPVTYQCDTATGTVRRHSGYGFAAVQPVAFGAGTSSVLVGDVAACPFSFLPAVLQRNGLVVLSLTLTRNGESVNLLHQVDILNTP
jgi:MSHA biogenesis protein MshO